MQILVWQNATVGTSVIQVRAVDSDIGQNGIVRYRFRQEFSGHSETFDINPTTGVLTLAKPLDREQQKVYHVSHTLFLIPFLHFFNDDKP